MAEEIDAILLKRKNVPRSFLMIPKDLYQRNKSSYDKAGYIEATKDEVKTYFEKRGLKFEEEKPKKTTAKKKEAAKSSDDK